MRISILTPSIRPEMVEVMKPAIEAQTFKDFEWLVDIEEPSSTFTLPAAMNRLLRKSQGEIIVILQDGISIPPDALESINNFSQYKKVAWTYPVGKQQGDRVKFDWRTGLDLMFDIQPNEWETDFASAPREMFFDIGGYDERFCNGWSWENVEVAWRAAAAGYTFKCNPEISAEAVDHDAIIEHPHREVLPPNDRLANLTRQNAEFGRYKLGYL